MKEGRYPWKENDYCDVCTHSGVCKYEAACREAEKNAKTMVVYDTNGTPVDEISYTVCCELRTLVSRFRSTNTRGGYL